MDDRIPTPTTPEADRTADSVPTYSVVEAATILGVSTDAIRARLHRGTLDGEKIEGIWHVRLPDDLTVSEATGKQQGQSGSQQAQTANAPDPQQDEIVEQLRSQIADLQERLDRDISHQRESAQLLIGQIADLKDQLNQRDSQQSEATKGLHAQVQDLQGRLDWAQQSIDQKDRMLSDVMADLARQRERTDVLQAQYQQAMRQLEASTSTTPPKEDEDADRTQQESTGESDSHEKGGWWSQFRRVILGG